MWELLREFSLFFYSKYRGNTDKFHCHGVVFNTVYCELLLNAR